MKAISSDASKAPDQATLRTSPGHELPGFNPALDAKRVLAALRTSISNGKLNLDAMLQHIAEAAQVVTCADGAAIAIRQGDLVICQASAGDMAPDLGTKLETDSGISGQCLRTGQALHCDDTSNDMRVDAEACRRLGLRSLAVVPVGKQPTVSGVLEVFSGVPNAFRHTHITVLGELADLVIAAKRRSAESAVQRFRQKLAHTTQQSWSKRTLILAVPTVLVLLGWLVFSRSHSPTAPVQPLTAPVRSPAADASAAVVLKPDRSPTMHARNTRLPSGVVMASKTEKAGLSEDVVVRKLGAEPDSKPNAAANSELPTPPPQNLDSPAEPAPALAVVSTSSENALGGLLSASTTLPQAAITVSQGLSGGTIKRQVKPTYPPLALRQRLEGRVLLQAVVTEDGTLRDVKVLKGDSLLAHAAMEAVARWSYRPYRLNGQPISMPTEITVVFKLP